MISAVSRLPLLRSKSFCPYSKQYDSLTLFRMDVSTRSPFWMNRRRNDVLCIENVFIYDNIPPRNSSSIVSSASNSGSSTHQGTKTQAGKIEPPIKHDHSNPSECANRDDEEDAEHFLIKSKSESYLSYPNRIGDHLLLKKAYAISVL